MDWTEKRAWVDKRAVRVVFLVFPMMMLFARILEVMTAMTLWHGGWCCLPVLKSMDLARRGGGCSMGGGACKPALRSMLILFWNEKILSFDCVFWGAVVS